MTDKTPTPEEQADMLLEELARSRGLSLRQLGIMDKRRQATVARREIPLSRFERKKREASEGHD